MNNQEFAQLTQQGLVILDGATGSNLTKAGMPKGISTELWTLEHAEVLIKLQREYVEAGTQIVYAPHSLQIGSVLPIMAWRIK